VVEHIIRLGKPNGKGQYVVKFKTIFEDKICESEFEALAGTLKGAKKRKVITFKGQILLQGMSDNVDIVLLKGNPEGTQAAAIPPPAPVDVRAKSANAKLQKSGNKTPPGTKSLRHPFPFIFWTCMPLFRGPVLTSSLFCLSLTRLDAESKLAKGGSWSSTHHQSFFLRVPRPPVFSLAIGFLRISFLYPGLPSPYFMQPMSSLAHCLTGLII